MWNPTEPSSYLWVSLTVYSLSRLLGWGHLLLLLFLPRLLLLFLGNSLLLLALLLPRLRMNLLLILGTETIGDRQGELDSHELSVKERDSRACYIRMGTEERIT